VLSCTPWDRLAAELRSCVACPELAAARTSVVVGVAPPAARLLLVGEAPGAEEDAAGVPFVGQAGRLLDRVLAEVGLPRAAVGVVNVLKCRPPGNRKPRADEVARCRGWLTAQLTAVDPALVVALGGTATEWFLGRGSRLGSVRGRVHEVAGRRVLPTYHPSAAIRFGPSGAPLAALRADLALAASLLG
jgi:DNA polymerase